MARPDPPSDRTRLLAQVVACCARAQQAAADDVGPPSCDREVERTGERVHRTADRLRRELGSLDAWSRRRPKDGLLEAIGASVHFRFAKVVLLISEEGAARTASCTWA
jgi:hypothetical protein